MKSRIVTRPFLLIIFLTLVACRQSEPKLNYQNDKTTLVISPEPKLYYQNDKNTLVISADAQLSPAGGLLGEYCNHIPDLRVWGDGRVIFSQYSPDRKRSVKIGNFDKSQIQTLLQLIAKSGFFRPNTPEVPNPAGTGYELKVVLTSGTYDYNWTFQPIIYSDLIKAAGAYDLAEFTPERALLVSSPYYPDWTQPKTDLPIWPSEYSFSLAEADKGSWVSGDMLTFLWNSVNNSRYIVPGFQEDNKSYSIALQVPGVSFAEPPFNCWGSVKTITP